MFPEGWVIQGVELVASPVNGYHNTGAKNSAGPFLRQDDYDGGSVSFTTVVTGANVKTITDAMLTTATLLAVTAMVISTLGNYNTVFIPFPEQPALDPNTSYRVGYSIEEDGYFALAQEAQGSYRVASPTRPDGYDTIIYFANNEATAKYAHIFTPNQYQNFVRDPSRPTDNTLFASAFIEDYNPMIRMIVGPRQEVERHDIEVSCEGEDYGEVAYAGRNACGETIHCPGTVSATITADSAFGFKVAQL